MNEENNTQALDASRVEIDAHLAEYEALRTEIDHYLQRIDRISGVYITAMFGIVGYLVRPDSTFDPEQYMTQIRMSPILTSLFLFIPILNSMLLIRVGSFFLGMLAIAQYICYTLRCRVKIN